MPPVPCPGCGNKMSSDALVCPHCGKRRGGGGSSAASSGGGGSGDGGLAGVKLSREELRALATVTAPAEQPRGLFATSILPHPETTGATRTAELLLTIACAPLIVCGAMMIGIGRRISRRATIGEGEAAVTMAVSGGVGLAWALADYGAPIAIGVIALEIALLAVRGRIRVRASRSHRLTAIGD